VRGAERLGDPGHEGDGLAEGERAALQAGLEDLAVDPLHGEEQPPRGRHAVGDVADDAGVRELREHLDLAREALGEGALPVGDDLDGHGLAGGRIAGAEHRAHAAGADRLLELEPIVEPLPGDHEGRCSALNWLDRVYARGTRALSITGSCRTEGPRSQAFHPDLMTAIARLGA
jgi:hypothetical protein